MATYRQDLMAANTGLVLLFGGYGFPRLILAPSFSSQSSSCGVSVGTKTRTDQSCSKVFFETKIEGERLCCPIDFPMSSGCS